MFERHNDPCAPLSDKREIVQAALLSLRGHNLATRVWPFALTMTAQFYAAVQELSLNLQQRELLGPKFEISGAHGVIDREVSAARRY
jgi:hypothetical protein